MRPSCCHCRLQKIKRWGIGVASNGVMSKPNLAEISESVQHFKWEDRETHKQHVDLIRLLSVLNIARKSKTGRYVITQTTMYFGAVKQTYAMWVARLDGRRIGFFRQGLHSRINSLYNYKLTFRKYNSTNGNSKPISVMKNTIFWDITPCSPLSVNRRFGWTYRLHLQGQRNAACHLLARWFLTELIS
jgi:hypothetical protein